MQNVLIIGTTNIYGGVGKIMFDLCMGVDPESVRFDFLYYQDATDEEKELIKKLNGGFFLVPKYSRHPLLFFRRLNEFFCTHQYDTVHCHASTAMLIMYTLPLWKGKHTRIVYHSHLDYVEGGFNRLLHRLMRFFVLRETDVFLAVSNQAAAFMYGRGIVSEKKYILIKNGVNVRKYQYSEKTCERIREKHKLGNKYIIGHVGRFTEQKNHAFIIDVFNKVHDLDESAVLLLVGSGELEEEIRRDVNRRGLCSSILFFGTTPFVAEILQALDVFFFPSKWEGLGIVAIEAQAAGLPVVASTSVPKEAAITTEFHYMDLNKDSTDVWAEKLLSFKGVYNRSDNYSAIIRAGYDIESSAKKLETIYLGSA